MFRSARTVSVALAAALLITACGSDDNDTADTSDTTVAEAAPETTEAATETTEATTDTTATAEETTTTTEAPAQDVEADTTAARAAVLTVADLPEGWTETAPAAEGVSDIDGLLAECVGVTPSDARATTATFASPDGNLVVVGSVGVQATERDARLVIAGITNPDVVDCIAAAHTELGAGALSAGAVADGSALGEITATRLPVGSVGDSTQAIRVTIPVADGSATITVDHVIARSGRSLSLLSFEGRVEPTPVETIDEIALLAASRLPA